MGLIPRVCNQPGGRNLSKRKGNVERKGGKEGRKGSKGRGGGEETRKGNKEMKGGKETRKGDKVPNRHQSVVGGLSRCGPPAG